MKKIFILISHPLNQSQKDNILSQLNIDNIVLLPEELLKQWSSIPPEMESIKEIILPIKNFLDENAKSGDYVLVQGDMGATYIVVNYAFEKGLIPCYSTTKRITLREENNQDTINLSKQFKHIIFRKYEK